MNQKGEGFSKYKNIYINRFKVTDDYPQGIFFAVKNIKTKSILTSNYTKDSQYKVTFAPDKVEQEITKENLKAKIETIVATKEPLEIRKMTLENLGNEEEIVEVTAYFEPVLSRKEQDYAHPTFNNLFLIFDYDEESNSLIVKRKKRELHDKEIYLAVNLSTNSETIGDLEYEIDEEKSNIAEGTYNNTEKTITWQEKIENIDTFSSEAKNISITKEITLVYKNLDVTKENVTNSEMQQTAAFRFNSRSPAHIREPLSL